MFKRLPVSPLGKVAAASVTTAALTLFAIAVQLKPDPVIVVVGLLLLAAAALVMAGFRWAPSLAAALGAIVLVANASVVKVVFFDPTDPGYGHVMLSALCSGVALVTGAAATWQNYRSEERHAPRWLSGVLVGLFTLWAGATLVATMSEKGAAAAIAPEAAQEMLTMQTQNSTFLQQEIRVKAGDLVTIRLENLDAMNHTFDIDELEVHAAMPASATNVAVFKATKPGTYTIYCVPHYNKQSGQGMRATLIVEP